MSSSPEYWNKISKKKSNGQNFDILLAEQFKLAHLEMVRQWVEIAEFKKILKTDLFAEAECPSRSFLWDILKFNGYVTGIDVSDQICQKAGEIARMYSNGNRPEFIPCDVRKLPFPENSFDLIISDSTLDHFKKKDDINIALSELTRVLAPGGTLIITMDNKGNITDPLFRLWILLGLSPFYIGKTYTIAQLKSNLMKSGLRVEDSTTLIHNPRFFTKAIALFLRKFQPAKADGRIKRLLSCYDNWKNKRTRYLTAQFIAVKAVKPAAK
jgi:SAM-dependent methyltransferase